MNRKAFRNIFLIWLAWALIVIGFQALATARFQPRFPDRAQDWTTDYTLPGTYQVNRPYLVGSFMNAQVCWDSEYYLSISIAGYDDPKVPHLTPSGGITNWRDGMLLNGKPYVGDSLSLNYAFFPFYPWTMWVFSQPLKLLGLGTLSTATLSGVIVSALGALLGMLALYDLTADTLGEDGAMRSVFYLLIFPTGFFLVQIYTEGLFVGLAFSCLAVLRRGKWIWAAILGAAATLTRAVGIALIIPMAITWFRTGDWLDIDLEWRQIFYWWKESWRALFLAVRKIFRTIFGIHKPDDPDWAWLRQKLVVVVSLGKMLLAFAPLITYLIWKFSRLGLNFDFVENNYFGRQVLDFGAAFYNWSTAFRSLFMGIPERTAYFLTEFLGLTIGVATCIACIRRYPEIAWFSLAVLIISVGSGPAQGTIRYILGAPAVFVMLAHWGRNKVFDRAWTIASILLMGLLAMLFAFNFWVA
jgi:Mannosyltransferase (PIG-V)